MRVFSAMKVKAAELIEAGKSRISDIHELAIRLAWGSDEQIAAAMVS